jgi:16S rRNA (uracil1498-N3)-methyltransferase
MYIFIPKLESQTLSPEHSMHLWSLRPKVGEVFGCTDLNGQVAKLKILEVDKRAKTFEIEIWDIFRTGNDSQNVLFQAIPDKIYLDKLFEILPFCNLSTLYFFFSDRSLEYQLNLERLDKILVRSCEQAEIYFKPKVVFIQNKQDQNSLLESYMPKVLECNLSFSSSDSKETIASQSSVLVGPEGGWSERELELFKSLGLQFVHLGNTIYPAWLAGFGYFLRTNKSTK